MLKDIPQLSVENIIVAIVREPNIEGELIWNAYLVNLYDQVIKNVIVSSKGYGSFEGRDSKALIQNGYNHQRSGNAAYELKPGWMDHEKTGTTHGASYSYDTHVPVIFYGNGIEKGSSLNYFKITQIAPTISDLIKINYQSGCTDDPIEKVLTK